MDHGQNARNRKPLDSAYPHANLAIPTNLAASELDAQHCQAKSSDFAGPFRLYECADEGLQLDSQSVLQQLCVGLASLPSAVKRARKLKRLRKALLGTEFFSGPAWDILLHLFDSHLSQRRDTITNLAGHAEVPATTSLRWIKRLEEEGLIVCMPDHFDGRRRFVLLSEKGAATMTRYFSGVAPHLVTA